MKDLTINFRHPNVDRFVEVVAMVRTLGFNYGFHIDGMPEGYMGFLGEILYDSPLGWESRDKTTRLFIEYPEPGTDFNYVFNARLEDVETIKNRIASASKIENTKLDEGSRTLLKTAYQRLSLNRDQLQTIIHVGYAIACLEQAKLIGAHHIAEAIGYSRDPLL